MSIRILHLADLHIGASFPSMGDRGEERSRDFLAALLRAVEWAVSDPKPVDLVAIAGDLFDTHDPEEGLVVQVEAAMERLEAAGVPVLIAPGTHDAPSYRRSVYRRLRLPKNVHLFLSPTIEAGPRITVGGLSVQTYGLAYDGAVCERPLGEFRPSGLADLHVGIMHAALEDNPNWKRRQNDMPVNRTEIAASGLHYLAFGHYHNFSEIREGGAIAVYPGTLEGKKFGEDGPRYLVTATLGREQINIDRMPWNQRTLTQALVDLQVADFDDEAGLAQRLIPFAGERELVRVRLEGPARFVFDAERLLTRLAPRFFHLEIDDRTYVVNEQLLEKYREEATVRGVFVRNMLERIENAKDDASRETATLALRIGLAEFQNPRHAS